MSEEQDNQIERRDSAGINRRSETARRGSDAAGFVRSLANRRTDSDPLSSVTTDRTYEFSLKWGTYGWGDGEFYFPLDVAVGSDGSVYVTSQANPSGLFDPEAGQLSTSIQKFTSEGVFASNYSGMEGLDFGVKLCGITVAPDGSVYATDQGTHRICKFTSEGVVLSKWGTYGSGDGEFNNPDRVAVAAEGTVFVTDWSNNRVQKFTSEGVFVAKWGIEGSGNGEFIRPAGIGVASDGSVYIADTNNHRIQRFTSEGVFASKWGTGGTGDGEFQYPNYVAVAPDGTVYVADYSNHRIQRFTSEGVFVTKWGTDGVGDGEFRGPEGVAVASDGSVYIADPGNDRIQRFLVGP